MEAPQFPAGPPVIEENLSPERRRHFIEILREAPAKLRVAVAGLGDEQLDSKYRNWTIRQIVHHLADSHTNMYVRIKWALTEDNPTIKPYDETQWSELPDAKAGDVETPLKLLEALHAQIVRILSLMTARDFQRTYFHPEYKKTYWLEQVLPIYAWHCLHHTAQIRFVREMHGW